MVSWNMHDVLTTTTVDGIMHVHFTYFAQIDPEITFEILRRLRLP